MSSKETNGAPKKGAINDKMPFETALNELELLVEKMENGEMMLEESINAFERGSALVAHCKTQLNTAEQKIKVFEEGALNNPLRDFSPENRGNS